RFMKKVILILLITSLILTILLLIVFQSIDTNVEKVKLRNDTLDEVIYLKRFTRGLNYEVNVVTLRKGYFEPDTTKEIVDKTGSPFFYKLDNDTLYIYGGMWENIGENFFKTPIVYEK